MSCTVDFDDAPATAQHLAQCADCRLAAHVRDAFRGAAEAEIGDELLVARTVNRVLTRRPRLRRSERRGWAVAAALLLFGTGVASGSLLVHWHVLPTERGAAPSGPPRARNGARTRRHGPSTTARSDETQAALAQDDGTPSEASSERAWATQKEGHPSDLEQDEVTQPAATSPSEPAETNGAAPTRAQKAADAVGTPRTAAGGASPTDVVGASFTGSSAAHRTAPSRKTSTARSSSPPAVPRMALSAKAPAPSSELTTPSATSLSAQEPSALLAGGLAARSQGETAQAIVFFETLERRFPETPEAIVSFVSLGALFLDRDEADRALTAFERYLAAAPSGTLVEEALAGKARALSALGRAEEARAVLRTLGARFPSSPHVRASSRLP